MDSEMTSKHEPNPRRVAAGQLNRQKRGPLTEAGRERLRAGALRHKPWLKTTGPRTLEGKRRAAQNGRTLRGSLSIRQARSVLAEVRSLMRTMAELAKSVAT
jgi:hypothetical protein